MVSGHFCVVESGSVLTDVPALIDSITSAPAGIEFTSYEAFSEELRVMGMSKTEFAESAGYSLATVYSWKRHGLPKPVAAYMSLLLAYTDRVNPEKSIQIN